MYTLLLHQRIEKDLARLPQTEAQRIVTAIRQLSEQPRPAVAKHLTEELYRVRVGNYRIVYAIFDAENIVFIGKVARRSEQTYRDLPAILAAARRARM